MFSNRQWWGGGGVYVWLGEVGWQLVMNSFLQLQQGSGPGWEMRQWSSKKPGQEGPGLRKSFKSIQQSVGSRWPDLFFEMPPFPTSRLPPAPPPLPVTLGEMRDSCSYQGEQCRTAGSCVLSKQHIQWSDLRFILTCSSWFVHAFGSSSLVGHCSRVD